MAHKQSENLVYKLVLSAELEIDAEGRIWRVAKRTFDRWTGGTKVTPCTRVRAEQKTPDGYLHAVQVLGAGHHDVKGSNHPKARVSEVDVLSMRRLRAQGWRVRDIAERFGTTPNAVSHACRGKTWKHVPTS